MSTKSHSSEYKSIPEPEAPMVKKKRYNSCIKQEKAKIVKVSMKTWGQPQGSVKVVIPKEFNADNA